MRALISFLLSLICAHAQAATVYPGVGSTAQTITSKGLLVGENWVTNDKDNYVQNAECFKGTTGIAATGTGASVARNTTTPLGEVSDCLVSMSNADTYVEWNVRTLPRSLIGQSCSLYVQAINGFLQGPTTQSLRVMQNSVVVANQVLSRANAALPYAINVPCGSATDVASTKIRIYTDSTSGGSGNISIAGIRYGDARLFNITDATNITAWTSYTPVVTGFGTSPATHGVWRRVGDSMEIQMGVRVTNTAGATNKVWSIPFGYAVDLTKFTNTAGARGSSGQTGPLGAALITDVTTGVTYNGTLFLNTDGTSLQTYGGGGATAWTNTVPVAISTNQFYQSTVTVPILNWTSASSAVTPASSTKTAINYNTAVAQSIPDNTETIIDFGTLVNSQGCGTVTTGASWRFTPCFTGWYTVDAATLFASSAWTTGNLIETAIRKNGARVHRSAWVAQTTATYFAPTARVGSTIFLTTSDYIDVIILQNRGAATSLISGTGSYNTISIVQADGPNSPVFIQGPVREPVLQINTSAALTFENSVYYVDTTATRAPTLPLCATGLIGYALTVKDDTGNAGANNITVTRTGSDTIDGATTSVLNVNWASRTFRCARAGIWRVE